MKTHFFAFCLFLAFISEGSVEAARLYAYLVCDTNASNIEDSVEADYIHMRNEVYKICQYTHLRPHIKRFLGRKANAEVLDSIRKRKVGKDDVLLFYYSGHGMRFVSQEDPWPVLDFESGGEWVSQWEITQELMSKQARLVLSITDCCNNIVERSLLFKGRYADKKKNYCDLFLNSTGTYIATAAQPGEYSFGMNGNWWAADLRAGGFFTNALLETLREETRKEHAGLTWDAIFELAIIKTHDYQMRDEQDPVIYHTPHYLYIPSSSS